MKATRRLSLRLTGEGSARGRVWLAFALLSLTLAGGVAAHLSQQAGAAPPPPIDPLNPVSHRPQLKAPSGLAATGFLRRLQEQGVSATLRTQRGEDIAAACGQLALERSLADS